ncbi:MAG: glycoside hydrolase family 16 protein, partial [Verrucomicrobia bacterium]|nr:glycoside hydrolase family 16 protein [Verrucomicrobiota bacterium]
METLNHYCTLRLLAACMLFAHRAAGGTVLFDDFSGPTLSTSRWEVGFWELGNRTHLGGEPAFSSEGDVDYATLTLDTFNPDHAGTHFRGTEILSKVVFPRGGGIECEARLRVRDNTPGLVASFFVFEVYTNLQDEIDFEFITKQPTNTIFLVNWDDWDPGNRS